MAGRWTEAQEDQIAKLKLQDRKTSEIAAVVGRSVASVRQRMIKLQEEGELSPQRPRWTVEDEQNLWSLFWGGSDDARISKQLGRSAAAIIRKRRKMGLTRGPSGLPLMK